MTATIDELIASLMDRAMDGDLEAAKLVLAQPRRINIKPTEDDGASPRYVVWDALVAGRITLPEARELLAILRDL
jgi:hypothetical protein